MPVDTTPDAPYEVKGLMAPEQFQRIGRLLATHPYRFAKTMPHNPHWYTLREEWQDVGDEVYNEVITAIREHGYDEWFGGRKYRVLNVNGFKHWTYYGATVEEVIVLNRKPLDREKTREHYDVIAPLYDTVFSDAESLAENEAVMGLIGDCTDLNVLDIGCGTGLLLEYWQPKGYLGFDPSRAMLARLKAKHPAYADRVMQAKLEEFVPPEGPVYDLAVCLFGSAAYCDPAYVEYIPKLIRPGGRYVVMFMRDGYVPVTYEKVGMISDVPYHTGVFADLPGKRVELNEYIIVDGRVPE